MFNNTFTNNNSAPPNYYPNDNTFFNENNPKQENFNNFNLEKILPLLNGGVNLADLLKNFTNSNPAMAQVLGLLNTMQKAPKKTKTTAFKSDCNYVLVKDYYKDKN